VGSGKECVSFVVGVGLRLKGSVCMFFCIISFQQLIMAIEAQTLNSVV
jgi:hypothetical protein